MSGLRCWGRPGRPHARHSVDEGFIPRECRPEVQDVMAARAWAVAHALAGSEPALAVEPAAGGAGGPAQREERTCWQ